MIEVLRSVLILDDEFAVVRHQRRRNRPELQRPISAFSTEENPAAILNGINKIDATFYLGSARWNSAGFSRTAAARARMLSFIKGPRLRAVDGGRMMDVSPVPICTSSSSSKYSHMSMK